MPLVLGTLKSSKTDFHRSQHQKRKDEIRPFEILAFLLPTTVDIETKKTDESFDSSVLRKICSLQTNRIN